MTLQHDRVSVRVPAAGYENQPDRTNDQDADYERGDTRDAEKTGNQCEVTNMKCTHPLWVDPSLSAYPALDHDIEVDVAVIGAGIAGIGAARWLEQRKAGRIAVLERNTVASGATGRNAGFVMAVAPENFPATDDAVDVEEARRIWKFTAANQALIEATLEELSIDADYEKMGCLQLAASEEEYRQTVESAELAQASGLSVRIVSRSDLPTEWLTENYFGGAWFGDNAQMQPALFVRTLASRLNRRGVQIFEGTNVSTVASYSSHSILRANGHAVRCGHVVGTTNAYTSEWLPETGKWIEPKRGQVLATEPLASAPAPCPVYAKEGYQYWRQTPDGRLVLGGWRDTDFENEVGTNQVLHDSIQQTLERVARKLSGTNPRIDYRWSGIMGFTPDRRPLIGHVPRKPGCFIAAGYSGQGLAMAYAASREVVEMLFGGHSEYAGLFDPSRFSRVS